MALNGKLLAFVLVRLGATLAVGGVIGWALDAPWPGVALALLVVVGWHWIELYRLRFWLRNRRTADPPETFGAWSDVGVAIVRLHRRKRFHKARMLGLLRELRESTAALPDAVVVMNTAREIQWFNEPAMRLLGLRRVRDQGIRLDNLLRQPEIHEFLGRPVDDRSLVVRLVGDTEKWLLMRVLPFGEGRQLLLARDVTATQQLTTIRRDFVANASHELRTPLTVIAGYLEGLESDPELPAALQGPLTEMRRQSDRMRALLDDLLSLSKLDARENSVVGEPVDVPALLRQLHADALQRAPRPSQIELSIDSDQGLTGELALLQSAFWNLLENAVKYTPDSGRVLLRWWVDATGAHFSVTDNGPGIAPEHLPRLTERFYRVDPGRHAATGGTGLGLAIAKNALQKHDAELDIQSTPGTGSVFTCHFPTSRLAGVVNLLQKAG
jgi:two-component system phosphate regulon sensor histidine kinase PhoR